MDPDSPRSAGPGPGVVFVVVVAGLCAVFGGRILGGSGQGSFGAGVMTLIAAAYVLTLIDLRAGIAILIFCVGFSPEFAIGAVNNLRIEDALLPALLFGWLTQASRRREPFVGTPVSVPMFCVLIVATLSSLLGIVQGYVEPLYTGFRVAKTLEYFCLFWLLLNAVKTRGDFENLVLTTLVVGAASSVAALMEAYQTGGGDPGRATGPEGEGSNIFGGYVMIQCALLIGMFLGVRTARQKLMCAAGAIVSFWALMLSLSRTSYVALVIGLIVLALFRRRSILGWVFALGILFQISMPAVVVARASTILEIFGDHPPSSWNARVAAWQSLSRSIFSDPLLGRGVGVVGLAAADNEYMLQLAQSGVLGLLVFLWLLWRQMRVSTEAEQMAKGDPFPEGFALGSSLALLSLAVHGLGATSFTSIRTMEAFMIVAGLVGALQANYPRWAQESQRVVEREGWAAIRARRPRPRFGPGTLPAP